MSSNETEERGGASEKCAGWGKLRGARAFHFFADLDESSALVYSVCSQYFTSPFFWDRERAGELDRERSAHDRENCIGCRAWLSIPSNRARLVREGLA